MNNKAIISSKSINVYCDESCHLENDEFDIMVLGSIRCPKDELKNINSDIRMIKKKHGLNERFEVKWTKVSLGKINFYKELIYYFHDSDVLRFRSVLATEKKNLDHQKYNLGDYDLWYYKMYFILLDFIFAPDFNYNVYIDIKDTLGGRRVNKLHDVLCNNLYDFNKEVVTKIQQVRSHETELIPLADFITGAISYYHRYPDRTETGKGQIVKLLTDLGYDISKTSKYSERKFNLFVWRGRND